MTPGRIVVDRVSRIFRVYPKAQRTLKDVFVARGRLAARNVEALRDVSLTIEPGDDRFIEAVMEAYKLDPVRPDGSGINKAYLLLTGDAWPDIVRLNPSFVTAARMMSFATIYPQDRYSI